MLRMLAASTENVGGETALPRRALSMGVKSHRKQPMNCRGIYAVDHCPNKPRERGPVGRLQKRARQ